MTEYQEFLASKAVIAAPCGIDIEAALSLNLKDFQAAIARWALKRGRAAVFAGTGLGKTFMSLEWARVIHEQTGGDILIQSPLAVADQTVGEAVKWGIPKDPVTAMQRIRRAVRLWTNPDDVVLSPFAGIGSEGVVALELGRRFIIHVISVDQETSKFIAYQPDFPEDVAVSYASADEAVGRCVSKISGIEVVTIEVPK